MSRRSLVAVLACMGMLGAGAGTLAFARGREAATHTVVLKNIRFHPASLTIKRGDSVTWLWRDSTKHNVTGPGFKSKTQERGSFTVRFSKAGTYNYHCTIHVKEGMKGKIVVH